MSRPLNVKIQLIFNFKQFVVQSAEEFSISQVFKVLLCYYGCCMFLVLYYFRTPQKISCSHAIKSSKIFIHNTIKHFIFLLHLQLFSLCEVY